MARPALKNVSTASLTAELQRRAARLGKLLKLKEQVDRDIADLQTLAAQFGQPVADEAPVVTVGRGGGRKPGRKGKVAKAIAKSVATAEGKLGQYAHTATEFVLGLLASGKALASKELAQAWAAAGRGGKIDNTLGNLVKAKKLKRRKLQGQRGSHYTLAGSAVAAKPVGKKQAAAKLPTKRGKFAVTAAEFILDLLKNKPLTGRQVNEAWKNAGRGAVADSDLSNLVKAGKIKREKLGGKLGSNYSLAGTVTKAATKPVAKKGKKTFTCPTCKAVFGSGPMLGVHYKDQPTHRKA